MPITSPQPRSRIGPRLLQILVVVVFAAPALSAQATEILRGHVRGVGNSPLAGAQVTATPPGEPARSARTDGQGAYTISFPAGKGPYSLTVVMVGYAPMTKQAPALAAGATRPD